MLFRLKIIQIIPHLERQISVASSYLLDKSTKKQGLT
jgi:hypothetical protein